MMMNPCWILFIVIKFSLINCDNFVCNYLINKSDNTFDICMNFNCNQFVDPYSLMVRPNNCKTNYFSLTFSTYKKFDLFLNRIQWKLGDLFTSKLNNKIRQLRIYIKEINFDDKLINQNELNRLGINIDLYELYLQNLNENNSLYQLTHYDINQPEWNIIQIQFLCRSLIRLDENSCSTKIIPPSFLSPRRTKIITPFQFSSFPISTIPQQSKQQNINFIYLLIPILILFLTIFISIFVYKNLLKTRLLTSIKEERCSSIQSLSHNLDNNKNEFYSAKPYQISRLPSPHKDSLYKESH